MNGYNNRNTPFISLLQWQLNFDLYSTCFIPYHVFFCCSIFPLAQHQSFLWKKTLLILNRLYGNRWMKQTCEHKYSAYFSSPSWCWPSRGKILKNLKDCQVKISGILRMPDIKEQHFKSRKRSVVLESF